MLRRSWAAVLAVGSLFLLLGWSLDRGRGLTRTAIADSPERSELAVEKVSGFDLAGLDAAIAGRSGVKVHWRGAWDVPASGLYTLAIESRGRSSWTIDGHLAHDIAAPSDSGMPRTVWLASGFHPIEVVYEVDAASPHLAVSAAREGRRLEAIPSSALKPWLPRNPRLRDVTVILHRAVGWILIVLAVLATRKTLSIPVARWRTRFAGQDWQAARGRIAKAAAWMLLACVIAYGALLRLDAITARYGPVASPGWLAAVQTRTIARPEIIRPASFSWAPAPLYPHQDGPPTRYISDPYTYLKGAREMRSFYEAQWREPVISFSVKGGLALLGQQDVAVSFTSTLFALIAIGLTYVLGAALWSRPAGLLAALGFAIDREAVSYASLGWRDDAFVAAVALGAYLMLRCWRSGRERPRVVRLGRAEVDVAYLEALVLGVAAGLIVLVRIMAASFLLAGAVFLLLGMTTAWTRRWKMAGIGFAAATIVAAPYFVNCWRVYGDPLYTFNVHGNIYRIAEGRSETNQGTFAYVGEKIAARPFTMLDTIANGLTTYPFSNKWLGLEAWRRGLGRFASVAAIGGLILLASSTAGRLVLFVMVTSLIPFSVTWKVDPNWRFTEHALPFLLIAAAVALSVAGRFVWLILAPGQDAKALTSGRAHTPPSAGRPRRIVWAVIVTAALMGWWFIGKVSPQLVFAETLRAGEDGMVTAGAGDSAFFGRGWDGLADFGNVKMRVSAMEGTVSLRLPAIDDYRMMLRMDPFPRPLGEGPPRLPTIEFVLNGTSIGSAPMRWNPDRVGAYEIVLPRSAVRRGSNRFVVRIQRAPTPEADAGGRKPGLADGEAFGLWHVRVFPLSGHGVSAR